MFFTKNWNPDGQHCYVTGGSTGLGLELARLLTQKGAHVSIVARNQERLDEALSQLESERKYPGQKLHGYSFSLYTAAESAAALEAACAQHGGNTPDAVFPCAGVARPMYFVEMTEEDLRQGMDDAYWVQAWTIFAAVKQMVRQKRKGRLAMVSSVVGYMSFIGWASYAPGKQALRGSVGRTWERWSVGVGWVRLDHAKAVQKPGRLHDPVTNPPGLADTLQSELMLYPDISIHIYFPPSMLTPGFDAENKTKPQMRMMLSPPAFLQGVQKGHAHITSHFIADLFRASTRGVTPKQTWIMDAVYDMLAYFAAPIWRIGVDRRVRAAREEHSLHLQQQGFFD
ncbi:oxidoreductase [Mycena alexandri]|uniref:Oxidoreductase n=1 Tax=Mycena alexandri TaxID=1745969 RepID=A0AAD6T916_9AGAR|nr:oxidoreductase [Mycena alexandri]